MMRLTLNLNGSPTWGELRKFVEIGADVPDDQEIEIDYDANFEAVGLSVDISLGEM